MDIDLKKEMHKPDEGKFSFETIQNLKKIKAAFSVQDKRQVILNTWVCSFTHQSNADNINNIYVLNSLLRL